MLYHCMDGPQEDVEEGDSGNGSGDSTMSPASTAVPCTSTPIITLNGGETVTLQLLQPWLDPGKCFS